MLALLVLPLALHLDHMVLSAPPVQELQVQVLVNAYPSLLVGVVLLVPSVQELQMLQLEVALA